MATYLGLNFQSFDGSVAMFGQGGPDGMLAANEIEHGLESYELPAKDQNSKPVSSSNQALSGLARYAE